MTNILKALIHLINNTNNDVKSRYSSSNRINNVGEGLEEYVKDLFSNSLDVENEVNKLNRYTECFSYLGNNNNPPDLMIKNGDAIEVKKIEKPNNGIALNSSHPKNKLYKTDPRIKQACKDAEVWEVKDMIYAVGHVSEDKLKNIFFVYGDVYCASKETYEQVAGAIKSGIQEIPDITFTETNELGKVNNVDPLGITSLRVRGMWHIQNPHKVFDYLDIFSDAKYSCITLMKLEKYNSFPAEDRSSIEALVSDNFTIKNVKVKNPDNPAQMLDAKLLKLELL